MSSPKDGGEDGADTASIRCGDGERSVAGWDRTVNRMEGRRSGDGAFFERRETHFPLQFPVPEVKFSPGAAGHMAAGIVSWSDRCGITSFAVIFRENIWGTAGPYPKIGQ